MRRDYTTFMLPGIIVFTVVGDAVSGAMPLMWDKENGFLAKLLTAPISRSSIIVSRFLFMLGRSWCRRLGPGGRRRPGRAHRGGHGGRADDAADHGAAEAVADGVFLGLAFVVRDHGDFFAITGFITLPLFFMSTPSRP